MASSAIVLHDVLPLSSVAVLLMPAVIVVLSAIAVTFGVVFSRVVASSVTAIWAWLQGLLSSVRSLRRTIGVPLPVGL
jgi:hypothetical protein